MASFKLNLITKKSYINNLVPILIATNSTSPAVTKANIRVGNILKFKKFPNCPPTRTINKMYQ